MDPITFNLKRGAGLDTSYSNYYYLPTLTYDNVEDMLQYSLIRQFQKYPGPAQPPSDFGIGSMLFSSGNALSDFTVDSGYPENANRATAKGWQNVEFGTGKRHISGDEFFDPSTLEYSAPLADAGVTSILDRIVDRITAANSSVVVLANSGANTLMFSSNDGDTWTKANTANITTYWNITGNPYTKTGVVARVNTTFDYDIREIAFAPDFQSYTVLRTYPNNVGIHSPVLLGITTPNYTWYASQNYFNNDQRVYTSTDLINTTQVGVTSPSGQVYEGFVGDRVSDKIYGFRKTTNIYGSGLYRNIRIAVADATANTFTEVGAIYADNTDQDATKFPALDFVKIQCGASPGELYVAASGPYDTVTPVNVEKAYLFKSTDGGATWSYLSTLPVPTTGDNAWVNARVQNYVYDYINDIHYVRVYSGFYVSYDGGATFQPQASPAFNITGAIAFREDSNGDGQLIWGGSWDGYTNPTYSQPEFNGISRLTLKPATSTATLTNRKMLALYQPSANYSDPTGNSKLYESTNRNTFTLDSAFDTWQTSELVNKSRTRMFGNSCDLNNRGDENIVTIGRDAYYNNINYAVGMAVAVKQAGSTTYSTAYNNFGGLYYVGSSVLVDPTTATAVFADPPSGAANKASATVTCFTYGGISNIVTINNGGSGYTSNTVVTFSDPQEVGGIKPRAVVSIGVGGTITDILVMSVGSGYSSAPTVTITGTGTGATATATLGSTTQRMVKRINWISRGKGYDPAYGSIFGCSITSNVGTITNAFRARLSNTGGNNSAPATIVSDSVSGTAAMIVQGVGDGTNTLRNMVQTITGLGTNLSDKNYPGNNGSTVQTDLVAGADEGFYKSTDRVLFTTDFKAATPVWTEYSFPESRYTHYFDKTGNIAENKRIAAIVGACKEFASVGSYYSTVSGTYLSDPTAVLMYGYEFTGTSKTNMTITPALWLTSADPSTFSSGYVNLALHGGSEPNLLRRFTAQLPSWQNTSDFTTGAWPVTKFAWSWKNAVCVKPKSLQTYNSQMWVAGFTTFGTDGVQYINFLFSTNTGTDWTVKSNAITNAYLMDIAYVSSRDVWVITGRRALLADGFSLENDGWFVAETADFTNFTFYDHPVNY